MVQQCGKSQVILIVTDPRFATPSQNIKLSNELDWRPVSQNQQVWRAMTMMKWSVECVCPISRNKMPWPCPAAIIFVSMLTGYASPAFLMWPLFCRLRVLERMGCVFLGQGSRNLVDQVSIFQGFEIVCSFSFHVWNFCDLIFLK